MAGSKLDVIRQLDIGNPVAEEERDALSRYFVETEFWRKMFSGEVDVVYGAKGSGKSAIYLLLNDKQIDLEKKGIIVVNAENARGTPAFSEVASSPPTSEENFKRLWKLYFLALAVKTLVERNLADDKVAKIAKLLVEAGIDEPSSKGLKSIIASVMEYIRSFRPRVEAVEGTVTSDPTTSIPIFGGKISFAEPTSEQRKRDVRSIDNLFQDVDECLKANSQKIWILCDRLDVAFAESAELEKNAIRALFRAYGDLRSLDNIDLKVFIRTDIWNRITDEGYREASHITKEISISWDEKSLLNLIMRRLLSNAIIATHFGVQPNEVLSNSDAQEALFYRIFPKKVEVGAKRPNTLDWLLSRTVDGSGKYAPREVIGLLKHLLQKQIEKYERGEQEPAGEALFEGSTFKAALPELSDNRLVKTLYAEYPSEKKWIEKLRREKSEQTAETLADHWQVKLEEARKRAERLIEIGFFERRGSKVAPTYWVPFVYRPALELSQGKAD